MTETHIDITSDAQDLAQVASINFTPGDPTTTTMMAPTPEDWAIVNYQLHTTLVMASAVASKSKEELQDALAGGDPDGLLESMAATLRAAGERFGEFQAICEAAEARVYIAAGALSVSMPAGI